MQIKSPPPFVPDDSTHRRAASRPASRAHRRTSPGTSIQCDARSCQDWCRSWTHRQVLPTRAAISSIPPSGRWMYLGQRNQNKVLPVYGDLSTYLRPKLHLPTIKYDSEPWTSDKQVRYVLPTSSYHLFTKTEQLHHPTIDCHVHTFLKRYLWECTIKIWYT